MKLASREALEKSGKKARQILSCGRRKLKAQHPEICGERHLYIGGVAVGDFNTLGARAS
jgi:hypothetical protein